MARLLSDSAAYDPRIREARELFFADGHVPEGLVDKVLQVSWQRCKELGLRPEARDIDNEMATGSALNSACERNRMLIQAARGTMDQLHAQIRQSSSMILLSDDHGLILHSVGDADFAGRAATVALSPGAMWDECRRGTNAIGTALAERRAVEVHGAEHFFERNGFLTCSAAPLFDPRGQLLGVLDISSDCREYQRHTAALVGIAIQMIEARVFAAEHGQDIVFCFHPQSEHLGSLAEGMLAMAPDGRIRGTSRAALEVLGLSRAELMRQDCHGLLDIGLGPLIDRARLHPEGGSLRLRNGTCLYYRLHGKLPAARFETASVRAQAAAAEAPRGEAAMRLTQAPALDALATGDVALQAAIDRAKRVLGRDIPVLIQGESGVGKEVFAKAFHTSSPRRAGPFVALNCAAIPETLIESELFGYQSGAFTGARKDGAPGKIQQAHGGTLFLDEIGDMPLNLQARLLRVLQERCVTPLGSSKVIPVEFSLICATHRKLKDEVARGSFREDLYYRLNGLCVSLPPLRARSDLAAIAERLIDAEVRGARSIELSEAALRALTRYSWPGNIRQLHNVLRVALALMDEGETILCERHLSEEVFEEGEVSCEQSPRDAAPASLCGIGASAARLADIETQAIRETLEALGGNVSAAARKLGISRNKLYRKVGISGKL